MTRNALTTIMLTALIFASGTQALHAAEKGPVLVSIEHLYPTEGDRDIRTHNLNAWLQVEEIERINLAFLVGITATYAEGRITQLEGELSAGTLREVEYEGEAAGIGPGLMADIGLVRIGRLSLHLDASGSAILYNTNFPPGGDVYNFMFRAGPSVRYSLGSGSELGAGFRWMHVSNGQGMDSHNPSYDARGISLLYATRF